MTTSGKANDGKAEVQPGVTPRRSGGQINCEAIADTGLRVALLCPYA